MNMKELRERADSRAVEVAAEVGVALSTVRNWEQGRTLPKLRLDQYVKLLSLYNCTPEELLAAAHKSIQEGIAQ